MNTTLHDMRNDLAVAIGTVHALIDGMLEPTQRHFQDILESLEHLDAMVSELRSRLPATGVEKDQHLLAAIIEGSPYAKILINERGRIALVNAQTEKLFGYTRGELLGESIEMLVPERFRPGHTGLRQSFSEAPVARPMGAGRNLYCRRKDGSEVPVEIALNPITTDAETFTLASFTDITERKV